MLKCWTADNSELHNLGNRVSSTSSSCPEAPLISVSKSKYIGTRKESGVGCASRCCRIRSLMTLHRSKVFPDPISPTRNDNRLLPSVSAVALEPVTGVSQLLKHW